MVKKNDMFFLNSLTDLSLVQPTKPCKNKFSNKHSIFPLKSITSSVFKNYKNYLGMTNINGYVMDTKLINLSYCKKGILKPIMVFRYYYLFNLC